ncbi:cell wall-active antibiotics response protein LiaF [Marininema halotolerans]|uniref:Cell wall-active antibiotics response 4TMS YvqF n=1 Tax=Marininema halotolerans TaxID=1155944 RepID=A0A1I6Q400_9BACL|nr:cell wall-active antibiotics response protein LiaF [Marininema halotolerans]SFS47078.1 Cell wall-active antibiotics response 4TMS YvqF [Marininema halotolerans]
MRLFFNKGSLFACIIITLGVLFLLENVGVLPVHVTTLLSTWWPVIFFVLATSAFFQGLRPLFRKQPPDLGPLIGGTVLFLIGWNFLADQLQLPFLHWKTVASILWPLAMIYFGLRLLFHHHIPHRHYDHRYHRDHHRKMRRMIRDARRRGFHHAHHYDDDNAAHEADRACRETARKYRSHRGDHMMLGEIRIGKEPFHLENKEYWLGAGSIDLNLTQAIIPDEEVTLSVDAWFGEIQVYIPSHVPVKIDAFVRTGSLKVLENVHAGFYRYSNTQTPDFEEATKRLVLNLSIMCGEIRVIRV